jgi:tetratricopeptide (TPR) repeat protein
VITAKPKSQSSAPPAENKEAAKSCLLAADKFLKEGDFENAKEQVAKAKEFDPSNPYIYAFQDRIEYFEQLKKKEAAQPKPAAASPIAEQKAAVATPPPAPQIPTPFPPPPSTPIPAPSARQPAPQPAPRIEEHHPAAPIFPMTPPTLAAQEPVRTTVASAPSPPPPPRVEPRLAAKATSPLADEERVAKGEVQSMLMQMKQQIEELTRALEQEKRAREEVARHQLQSYVKQFRAALEKAWMNGAPAEKEAQELHRLAVSLGIPEDVEQSTVREVKLEMYSKAVKEMVAKRKLLKSSSSTMEWLRKVYQVSLAEYLENESKFLLDLVSDQFKGTLLYVTSDPNAKSSLVPKLKMAGYAVVLVPNPETALEKLEKVNPNIILCDAEFSEASLSGVKFLHVLRVNSKFNFLPFVLLCEVQEIPQVQTSELKPNEGLVKKPVDFDELSAVMNEKLAHFREYISSL